MVTAHQDAGAHQPCHRPETGQPLEKVESDTDRNYWMSAEEAVAYGMVSRIITDLKAL